MISVNKDNLMNWDKRTSQRLKTLFAMILLFKAFIALSVNWNPGLIPLIFAIMGFYIAYTTLTYNSVFKQAQEEFEYSYIIRRQRGFVLVLAFIVIWGVFYLSFFAILLSGNEYLLFPATVVLSFLALTLVRILRLHFKRMMIGNSILEPEQVSVFIEDRKFIEWGFHFFGGLTLIGALFPPLFYNMPFLLDWGPDFVWLFGVSLVYLTISFIFVFLAMISDTPHAPSCNTYPILLWFYRTNRTYTLASFFVKVLLTGIIFLSVFLETLTIAVIAVCSPILAVIMVYDWYEVERRKKNLEIPKKEKEM